MFFNQAFIFFPLNKHLFTSWKDAYILERVCHNYVHIFYFANFWWRKMHIFCRAFLIFLFSLYISLERELFCFWFWEVFYSKHCYDLLAQLTECDNICFGNFPKHNVIMKNLRIVFSTFVIRSLVQTDSIVSKLSDEKIELCVHHVSKTCESEACFKFTRVLKTSSV